MKKINELSHQLLEDGFLHIPSLCDYIQSTKISEREFKLYWSDLVLDQNYKSFTTRHRRILRYFYIHPGQFKINKNCMFNPKVNYKIEYQRGPQKLSYATNDFIKNSTINEIIKTDLSLIEPVLQQNHQYTVDIDLFRVSATDGKFSPTTSGRHQDGEDWLFMHFIGSKNIQPVFSTVYSSDQDNSIIFNNPLNQFLETLIVNDRIHYHAAGGVKQKEQNYPAYRDLLLVCLSAINT